MPSSRCTACRHLVTTAPARADPRAQARCPRCGEPLKRPGVPGWAVALAAGGVGAALLAGLLALGLALWPHFKAQPLPIAPVVNEPPAPPAPAPAPRGGPTLTLRAADLFLQFDRNVPHTDARFRGRRVALYGEVSFTGVDSDGTPWLAFDNPRLGSSIDGVKCRFANPEQLRGVVKGQLAGVRGTYQKCDRLIAVVVECELDPQLATREADAAEAARADLASLASGPEEKLRAGDERGNAAWRKRDYEAALGYWCRAVQFDARSPEAVSRHGACAYKIALAYKRLGRPQLSRDWARSASEWWETTGLAWRDQDALRRDLERDFPQD